MVDRILKDKLTIEEVERRLQNADEISRLCAISAEQYPRMKYEAGQIGDILADAGCSIASAQAVLRCMETAQRKYERQEVDAHARGDIQEH
jgi:hypothetical protein